MKALILKSTTASIALILAGCAQEAGEIGYLATSSNIGVANTNNTIVQSAYLRGGYLADMSARFRAAAPDTINFEFNRYNLDASARAILDKQAAWIRANPAIKFRVYGHTDLVGSNAYNQSLGLRRAQAAVNYLVARGVPRSKLEAVASYGETRPLINTGDPERLNRRTVTEVYGYASGYSGTDLDGKYANRIYNEYWQGGEVEIELADTDTTD
jgi:peptidoglycan-associated lipoprotein